MWLCVCVQCSKAFIESNVDLVPSLLFLRALSSQKLSAQFKNDLDRMVGAVGCGGGIGVGWGGMYLMVVCMYVCVCCRSF